MNIEEDKRYEIVQEGRDKYVAYKVTVVQGGERWFVIRRYKEFRRLYDDLVKQYPKAKLKIPPKKFFFNFSQSTINERVRGLTQLTNDILCVDEALSEDKVKEFLQLKDKVDDPEDDTLNGETVSSCDDDEAKLYESKLGETYTRKFTPEDFEFKKCIGKGSFGKVFMVEQRGTGQIYAIKVLAKNKLKGEKERLHLMSERSVLLNNLRHPFLVALHHSFQTSNKLFFVLDYVNGGELFFHLQKERRFTEERAKFYAAEIACALGYLHSRYVIYRDLKPENLLLDRYGHIVITDFGLAKEQMNKLENETTRTFCGTPEYLAPEVLLKKPYSYTLDWWCLGSVLYEMIFGAPPFYDRDHQRMYESIKTREPRLEKSSVALTDEGKSVLKLMLQKDPANRLGSKGDIKELEEHPFFKPLDFAMLENKNVKPPFLPNIQRDDDTRNIDKEFLVTPIGESVRRNDIQIGITSASDALNFEGFTYTRPYDQFMQ